MAKGIKLVRGLLNEGESSVALRDSLNRLLPGTNEDKLHFLMIADEEVLIYGELNKPHLDAKKNIPIRLRKNRRNGDGVCKVGQGARHRP
jgi:hypothetical protein